MRVETKRVDSHAEHILWFDSSQRCKARTALSQRALAPVGGGCTSHGSCSLRHQAPKLTTRFPLIFCLSYLIMIMTLSWPCSTCLLAWMVTHLSISDPSLPNAAAKGERPVWTSGLCSKATGLEDFWQLPDVIRWRRGYQLCCQLSKTIWKVWKQLGL
jgi:hypothetical protein